ncbi:MAG: DUF3524 domain-containing protein [Methylococcales bacterium]|nr:DUF3524 domain-containing protein [Methylococcales bacterium]MBT7444723.1 DUF3524 domain-containing protein [Methylococcales bacterium]
MNILLLSAYHTASHRSWCEGLLRHLPEHEWTLLSLPGRYFQWRIRGNPLSWRYHPALQQQYDLVIATSMVDLATLKGTNPQLAKTPSLLYVHENQFAYPVSDQQKQCVEPLMVNLYNLLAATKVVFNSEFNRKSCMEGLSVFLKKMPDHLPQGISDEIDAKSSVIPVPIEHEALPAREQNLLAQKPFTIVWNHRWEYDKGPERLLAIMHCVEARNLNVHWAIVGEQFRQIPTAMKQIQQQFSTSLKQYGYLPSRDEYLQCLAQSQMVLSTAIHEFQGLAVMEAVAQGAVPLVPNRLSYPHYFSQEYQYSSHENIEVEANNAADCIVKSVESRLSGNSGCVPDVSHYFWSQQKQVYELMIQSLVERE